MSRLGSKNCSKRDPILEPNLALGGVGTAYFHPWADKITQKALEGGQVAPKSRKMKPKTYPRAPKITIWGGNLPPQIAKNVPKLVPKSQNGAAT